MDYCSYTVSIGVLNLTGMLTKASNLKGVYVPVITPFKSNGTIDTEGLRETIRFLLKSGVHGICISCGTGEELYLSRDERKLNLEIAVKEVNGKVPVVAGTGHGTPSTRETVEYTKDAKDGGADAHLCAIDAQVTEEGMYEYYMDVGKVGLPVILYSLPTPRPITPTLVKRLLDGSDIFIGIKDSTGMDYLTECIRLNGDRISVFTGKDDYLIQAFTLGATGTICTISNVAPELVLDVYHGVKSGDLDRARKSFYRLLPITRFIYSRNADYQGPTKYLCELLGRPGGLPRRPQLPLTAVEKKQGRAALEAAGLL